MNEQEPDLNYHSYFAGCYDIVKPTFDNVTSFFYTQTLIREYRVAPVRNFAWPPTFWDKELVLLHQNDVITF